MKSVRIRSFSRPYFPAFGLNYRTEYLSGFSLNAEKYGPEKRKLIYRYAEIPYEGLEVKY